MPQYAVIIYERVPVPELPPEIMEAHGALPDRIAEAGGRVIAGLAVGPGSTATAIRDELITDGPFVETKEEMGGLFIIEARDLDHAISLAKMTPIAEGGVDVRPLTGFEVLEDG
ncbi:MAG TPA: YciI family protein [Solirubrobacterales bacterium]|nr:YciI family protein [Solirubrobacterales bacterium]